MNQLTCDRTVVAALADSTLTKLIFAPTWAQKAKNSTTLFVDTAGIAHKPESECWTRPDMRRAGQTTVVNAMITDHLCSRCR